MMIVLIIFCDPGWWLFWILQCVYSSSLSSISPNKDLGFFYYSSLFSVNVDRSLIKTNRVSPNSQNTRRNGYSHKQNYQFSSLVASCGYNWHAILVHAQPKSSESWVPTNFRSMQQIKSVHRYSKIRGQVLGNGLEQPCQMSQKCFKHFNASSWSLEIPTKRIQTKPWQIDWICSFWEPMFKVYVTLIQFRKNWTILNSWSMINHHC